MKDFRKTETYATCVSQHFQADTYTLLTYLLSYVLTYCTEQSPFWEANWFSTRQEIPRILWNPEVHYRIWHSGPCIV